MTIQRGEDVGELLARIDGALTEREREERRAEALKIEKIIFEKKLLSGGEFRGKAAAGLPGWEKILIALAIGLFAAQCAVYLIRGIWTAY